MGIRGPLPPASPADLEMQQKVRGAASAVVRDEAGGCEGSCRPQSGRRRITSSELCFV